MSWAGTSQSGLFWTINTGGGIARVDWEFPQGDVSGVIDNLLVIGLRGQSVSSVTPVLGDFLQYDGSQWGPASSGVAVSGITAHSLLSLTHPDTIPASPVDGDIIAGSGSPASWARFPVGPTGYVLTVSNAGSIAWEPPTGGPSSPSAPNIITSGTSIELDENDEIVIINKTVGSDTSILLPPFPILGQQVIIKDGKGDAGLGNEITVDASGAITIDGNTSVIIGRNYQSFTFLWNGTEWNII